MRALGLGLGLAFNNGIPVTPLTIFGAAATRLWLRADLGVSGIGTASATWKDQSGNWGADFTQATVSSQATSGIDGTINQIAFTFDGTNDVWGSTGLFPVPGTNPYALIVIAKVTSFAASGKPLVGADLFGPALATQASAKFGPQAGSIGPNVTGSTSWKRTIVEFTNSTSDRIVHGSVPATGVNSGNSRQANSYVGGIPTSSAFLACSVAEVIVVSPIPTLYTSFDVYVANRYGAGLLT